MKNKIIISKSCKLKKQDVFRMIWGTVKVGVGATLAWVQSVYLPSNSLPPYITVAGGYMISDLIQKYFSTTGYVENVDTSELQKPN